ncbi:hypothetical protein IG626_09350 [Desulfovibrio desulfuricans]|uniref:hypothetical protein n=1 Tax=Desulfovibrio desulfuricans TaxID=876 RepID=UPI00177C9D7A|nr:hypothetical protein [Desulfovibrio desulfuricans]MBD8896206.1 hypothetical protein [Desulfovibrio desulfuricans]
MESQNVDEKGWNPFTGERIFKTANAAWEKFGQYRFDVSKRNFLNFVGKGKACPPRKNGNICVEDIEIIGVSRGWPPAPAFVGGVSKGGKGEGASEESQDYAALYQREKALKEEVLRKGEELKLQKARGELITRVEYEQKLAAAAVVVATSAETWAYDRAREMIHQCGGDPAREDRVREWLLYEVRGWVHAFSRPQDYVVTLEEDEEGENAVGAAWVDDVAGEAPAPAYELAETSEDA